MFYNSTADRKAVKKKVFLTKLVFTTKSAKAFIDARRL